jgi:hypothetical protein
VNTFTQAFAAQRDAELTAADVDLRPLVADALAAMYAGEPDDWWDDLVAGAEVLWLETYDQAGAEPTMAQIRAFGDMLGEALMATSDRYGMVTDAQTDTVTRWVSTFTVNNATASAAAAPTSAAVDVVWVTMHDDDVRASHAALDGEVQPVGGTFDVDGHRLHYPGEPVGPPETFVNCRCVLMPLEAQMTAAAVEPEIEADVPTSGFEDLDHLVPWYGVIAPVGVRSGDRRELAPNALRYRELPVPMSWQKISAPGHDGSVVVANIEKMWEEDGLIKASGSFAATPEANEVISLIAQRMLRGVSIDLDDTAAFELVTEDGEPFDVESYQAGDPAPIQRMVDGRIASASIVAIPAFQEAYIRLGTWDDDPEALTASGCAPCQAASEMDAFFETLTDYAISESDWDGAASRFDDDQWKASTVVDRGESFDTAKERYAVPIKEPNGDLSRAGVHAAASRIDQTDAPPEAIAAAKRKLVAAYRQLEEEPPESLTASARAWVGVFADNPFPPEPEAPADDTSQVKVGDEVEWLTQSAQGDEVTLHGEVTAVDGDMATVLTDDPEDGGEYEVAVADLTVVDAEDDTEDSAGRPFAVTSNPGTHDGPGWITNPDDTQRLRTYWTRGEGAAKIRWGTPNDFYRCETQLRKYIPNPHHLAGTCANMHKVALGVWPGQHAAADTVPLTAAAAPAFTLVASAAAAPPADWFTDPGFEKLTPLTVVESGGRHRVMGHLAAWNTCHIGLGLGVGDGEGCVSPPSSGSGYAYFHTGAVRTDDDQLVPVGHITLGTGHAPASMAHRPAAAHYDNTGSVVADIAVGEDEHGIWFNGVLRAGADPDALQAAALSGDWRTPYAGAGYELVAALGVNVPGFPIPRLQVAASAAGPTSLVAAGVVLPYGHIEPFDKTSLARDVYNEVQTIGARADRRRKLATQMRVLRRDRLTATLGGR